MTLFVVAFLVIAALVLLLWLMVRPLTDETPALRAEAAPSIVAQDRTIGFHGQSDANGSRSSAFPAEEPQRRVGVGIGSSLESR